MRATVGEGLVSSALSAHEDESLGLWLPQPPFCHRPPEKHLQASSQELCLASTFRSAQYNLRRRGLGTDDRGVG